MSEKYSPTGVETGLVDADSKRINATEFSPGTTENGAPHNIIEGLPRVGAEAEDKRRSQNFKNKIDYLWNRTPDEYWTGYNSQEEQVKHAGDIAGREAMIKKVYNDAYKEERRRGGSIKEAKETALEEKIKFKKLLGLSTAEDEGGYPGI